MSDFHLAAADAVLSQHGKNKLVVFVTSGRWAGRNSVSVTDGCTGLGRVKKQFNVWAWPRWAWPSGETPAIFSAGQF